MTDLNASFNPISVLQAVSAEGPSAFYNGSLTTSVLREIQTLGGVIDQNDLSNYAVRNKPTVGVKSLK